MTDKTRELADRFFAISDSRYFGEGRTVEQYYDNTILVIPKHSNIETIIVKLCIENFKYAWIQEEGLVLGD